MSGIDRTIRVVVNVTHTPPSWESVELLEMSFLDLALLCVISQCGDPEVDLPEVICRLIAMFFNTSWCFL